MAEIIIKKAQQIEKSRPSREMLVEKSSLKTTAAAKPRKHTSMKRARAMQLFFTENQNRRKERRKKRMAKLTVSIVKIRSIGGTKKRKDEEKQLRR